MARSRELGPSWGTKLLKLRFELGLKTQESHFKSPTYGNLQYLNFNESTPHNFLISESMSPSQVEASVLQLRLTLNSIINLNKLKFDELLFKGLVSRYHAVETLQRTRGSASTCSNACFFFSLRVPTLTRC